MRYEHTTFDVEQEADDGSNNDVSYESPHHNVCVTHDVVSLWNPPIAVVAAAASTAE